MNEHFWSKKIRDQAAHEMLEDERAKQEKDGKSASSRAETKEDHKVRLQHLKKAGGNSLILSSMLRLGSKHEAHASISLSLTLIYMDAPCRFIFDTWFDTKLRARTHNLNMFNMRLVLLVGTRLWSEQGHKAKNKTTPEQDRDHSVAAALGAGELFLRGLWRDAICNAAWLA